jgi:N-hydroxyarylamine O-acetyltransferase
MIEAYLARIGWPGGAPRADRATLDALLALQAAAIPFEGIGALLGETPELVPEALHGKLLARPRGGWCFEQNTLLATALEALGFRVTRLAARVVFGAPPGRMMPRTHMALRVDLPEGPVLADAGFGVATPTRALPLAGATEMATPHERFRWRPHALGQMLQAELDEAWTDLYLLGLEPVQDVDLEDANWIVANRPGGLFTANLVAALSPPGERRRLLNRRFSVTDAGGTERVERLETPAALGAVLREQFGIGLAAAEIAALDAAISARRPGHVEA